MHTRHTGLETTWTQRLDDRRHLRVFVWADIDFMHAAFREHFPNDLRRDYSGRCMTTGWVVNRETGERFSGSKFVEVHLVRDRIGAGYVAHELQHAIGYYCQFAGWAFDDHDEQIAELAETVTTAFWNEFYKRFRENMDEK